MQFVSKGLCFLILRNVAKLPPKKLSQFLLHPTVNASSWESTLERKQQCLRASPEGKTG